MSRAIDALIAEHVFKLDPEAEGDKLRSYMTNIFAAWSIVDMLKSKNNPFISMFQGVWTVSFDDISKATSDKICPAICYAALKHLRIPLP